MRFLTTGRDSSASTYQHGFIRRPVLRSGHVLAALAIPLSPDILALTFPRL